MTYKYLGRDMTISCTPQPTTMFDNRSCRERTGCTKECQPKTLKCDLCESMYSSLSVYEDIETGKHIRICYGCKNEFESLQK